MGSADIVPGVSGGTIAFIFGVYEELIFSIKKMSGEVIKLGLQFKFKEAIAATPLKFLMPLGVGLITAIITLSSTLEHLLETQPLYIWSFFFGLVLASIYIVRKRVITWDPHDYLALAITTVLAFMITGIVPTETATTPIAFFLSGAIAITAMILPGVSGSFLLIMMGKYEQILSAVTEQDFFILGIFILGAILGLALSSRVLSWLFKNHHDIAVASLTGFMVGSLRKIWPWKYAGDNILPMEFSPEFAVSIGLIILSMTMMFYLNSLQVVDTHTEDVDKAFGKAHEKAIKSQRHR